MIVEVVAGVIVGQAIPEHTRRWVITSAEWEELVRKPGGVTELLADRNGRALAYAGLLMLQSDQLNWVRTEWIWL